MENRFGEFSDESVFLNRRPGVRVTPRALDSNRLCNPAMPEPNQFHLRRSTAFLQPFYSLPDSLKHPFTILVVPTEKL